MANSTNLTDSRMTNSTNLTESRMANSTNLTESTTALYDNYAFDPYENLPPTYKEVVNVFSKAMPVIIVLSAFGNIMIMIVMSRQQNKSMSTSVFFIALAVSDLVFTITETCERFLMNEFQMVFFSPDRGLFLVTMAIGYANINISAWILVAITVERAVCLVFPFDSKRICTFRIAGLFVFIVVTIQLGVNVAMFSTLVDLIVVNGLFPILVDKVPGGNDILAWVDVFTGTLVPIALITVGSTIIVFRLYRISHFKSSTDRNVSERNRSVALTLVSANVALVVTLLPLRLLPFFKSSTKPNLYFVLEDVFLFFLESNSALNFYLYFLSGSKFREDVLNLLSCKKRTFSDNQKKSGVTSPSTVSTENGSVQN